MNKIRSSEEKHIIDILVNVYNCNEKEINSLNRSELDAKLKKKQKEYVQNKKNPNAFFIIKDLPAPKVHETKTTKKGGVWVVLAFISVMILFGGMMFWWAFK